MKNIAIVLAAGFGKRFGNMHLPKQFIKIYNTPIIILTLEKIIKANIFDKICVVLNRKWICYFKNLLKYYSMQNKIISIINGGMQRINSIENALDYLKYNNIELDDIVVIHDAVRPFVSQEILCNSVNMTKKYGASVPIIPVKDTIIVVDADFGNCVANRKHIFQCQSPCGFKFHIIYDAIKTLTVEERDIITGTSQICQCRGIPVHTYSGDEQNIKITTQFDLQVARCIFAQEIRSNKRT